LVGTTDTNWKMPLKGCGIAGLEGIDASERLWHCDTGGGSTNMFFPNGWREMASRGWYSEKRPSCHLSLKVERISSGL